MQTEVPDRPNAIFVRIFPVLILGIAGGFFDAYTYVARGGVFCNAQTGNLILMIIGFASGKGVSSFRYLVPVAFFVLATLLSEAVFYLVRRNADRRGEKSSLFRFHLSVLLVEAAVLAAVGCIPTDFPDLLPNALIASTAALQYHAFRDMSGIPLSTVFCTNNLRLLSGHLFTGMVGKDKKALVKAAKYILFIACFLAGVAIGYFLTVKTDTLAILFVSAAFVLLAAWGGIARGAAVRKAAEETKEKEAS